MNFEVLEVILNVFVRSYEISIVICVLYNHNCYKSHYHPLISFMPIQSLLFIQSSKPIFVFNIRKKKDVQFHKNKNKKSIFHLRKFFVLNRVLEEKKRKKIQKAAQKKLLLVLFICFEMTLFTVFIIIEIVKYLDSGRTGHTINVIKRLRKSVTALFNFEEFVHCEGYEFATFKNDFDIDIDSVEKDYGEAASDEFNGLGDRFESK